MSQRTQRRQRDRMVLFDAETQIIKNHIDNDRFAQAKPAIDTVIQLARDAGFGTDGLLIGELLHLKVHINTYLGIQTEEPSMQESPNKIVPNQQNQKDHVIRLINDIRNIQ